MLVTSLIILITLTLLVVSGTQSSLIQEKMTSAMREAHVSLQVAESGVKDAENMIEALTSVSDFSQQGTGGKYSEGNGPADVFDNANWVDNLTSAATVSVSGQESRYYVEYLGMFTIDEDLSDININGYGETTTSGDINGFKIVARSVGKDGNTERVIVSYYGKRF